MAQDQDVSRRDFVKAAGAVSAVAAAIPAVHGAPAVQKVRAANDQVQYGIIGTGSRGSYLLKHLKGIDNGKCVAVCDINPDMRAVGQERAAERGLDGVVTFEQGNAEELAYPDRSFDCVTIAFGIRNVPRIERAIAQAHRVLKLGGRFLCLEFSSVDVPGLDALYELYSFQVIPRIGDAVAGDRDAYQYLVESIRKFPKPKLFATMIEASGFRRVSFTPMTGGVVALHSGWRL